MSEWFLYTNVQKCWKYKRKFECSKIIKISWFFSLINGGAAAKERLARFGGWKQRKKALYIYIRHMSIYIIYSILWYFYDILITVGYLVIPNHYKQMLSTHLKVWLIAWRKKNEVKLFQKKCPVPVFEELFCVFRSNGRHLNVICKVCRENAGKTGWTTNQHKYTATNNCS